MAQFRTTKDILDEVLQKSGEPTNGTSPYESIALTYLNKAYQTIVGGGSIFSLNVDESWSWARARHPIVLELQPSYTQGQVTTTLGDTSITFTDAPTYSVAGWYFQIVGTRTVYRITEHETGIASATLDSAMLDESGTYSFRVFKLDYEIFPQFLYIDSRNDKLNFTEDGATEQVISLGHGSYSPTLLINHIVAKLNDTGASAYTGIYDSVLKQFSITSGGSTFTILGATGSSRRRSVLPTIGFDLLDFTGALTYSSTYIVNGVSRMIEPFKVFSLVPERPFIESTDPIELERQYPMGVTGENLPTLFCKIAETNEGSITVRFNSYPPKKTKVTIDWLPIPIDLQDNDVSIPVIPRRDIDVLIHAASALILFDKEDSKWEVMLKLASAGLEAMQKNNRSELFKTGDNFAQIVPRADLAHKPRVLQYGYTVDGGARPAAVNETAQKMIKVTKTYSSFQDAATTSTDPIRTLPANRTLFALIVKHSEVFSGGSLSAVTMSVGIAGEPDKFISGFDLMQAVASDAQTSVLLLYNPSIETPITMTITGVGDNLTALTQGSVDIYFQETITEL